MSAEEDQDSSTEAISHRGAMPKGMAAPKVGGVVPRAPTRGSAAVGHFASKHSAEKGSAGKGAGKGAGKATNRVLEPMAAERSRSPRRRGPIGATAAGAVSAVGRRERSRSRERGPALTPTPSSATARPGSKAKAKAPSPTIMEAKSVAPSRATFLPSGDNARSGSEKIQDRRAGAPASKAGAPASKMAAVGTLMRTPKAYPKRNF
eukprot:gnl/TRDRNA2_/TRDRNA2_167533_c3_seq4.p1 gnl/TRDRNA2_/TRDRNA2_167533_c3~~gnl/TRDRNA2_/TRDRNA2_167533_c3_seq4.p1  ORF type:complete len:232 (+),score=29.28 gnl/TRDRNA2_/TRDRNA2_167533_c3_seq4:81-698(+)